MLSAPELAIQAEPESRPMPSVRRAAVVFAVVLAGLALGADPAPRTNPGHLVEIDTPTDTVKGRFVPATVVVNADYGRVELDLAKVRTLDFADRPDGSRGVTATLLDNSHVTGILGTATEFAVETATGTTAIPANDIEQIRFPRPSDTSLVAVLLGLLTLTLMEIVLGVDNIIFLALQANRLPPEQRAKARSLGLAAALGTRILLLLTLDFILGLSKPLFTLPATPFFATAESRGVSWRDIILLAGGIFLIGKSVWEMNEKPHTAGAEGASPTQYVGFASTIAVIAVIDIVFSLDSVITAVGMVEDVRVMIGAMTIAMLVMLVFSGPIARFVEAHPTVKVLALSFLILIGVLLVADGLGQHIDKGYIYFAMAFAVGIELINLRSRPAQS